jgi:hypothetical protein
MSGGKRPRLALSVFKNLSVFDLPRQTIAEAAKKGENAPRKPKTENRKPALTLPGESDKVAYR